MEFRDLLYTVYMGLSVSEQGIGKKEHCEVFLRRVIKDTLILCYSSFGSFSVDRGAHPDVT